MRRTGLVGTMEAVSRQRPPGSVLRRIHGGRANAVPLGRIGSSEEFANVACFLALDLASYVTGAAINVDGGLCPVF